MEKRNEKNPGPEQKFVAGGINAIVWKNKAERNGKEEEYHTINIEKRWKDKNGTWKGSNSFWVYELPKLQIVVGQAYEWCTIKRKEPGTTTNTDEDGKDTNESESVI